MPQCQFLFSAVFVFQKSYTRNILGIEWNKSQTSYFFWHKDRVQCKDGGGPGAGHIIGWRGSPWLRHQVVWAPGPPSDIALPPIYSLRGENLKSSSVHPRKVLQRHRHRRWSSEDRSLCSDTLPRRGIAPGAISITAVVSHDKEGVVLPRGSGLDR
jgi:hypothetical protein